MARANAIELGLCNDYPLSLSFGPFGRYCGNKLLPLVLNISTSLVSTSEYGQA